MGAASSGPASISYLNLLTQPPDSTYCLNLLFLQIPEELLTTELCKVKVADLLEKVEAPAAVEKVEEKGEEEEEVPAPVEDEDEAIRTRDPKAQTAQVGHELI